jgi:uncharacterized protein YgbK (DUF1537 family)
VLARQTQHKVGLVPLKQVQAGAASLRGALDKLAADGVRHVVVDAVADTDLGIIGEAVGDDKLVTGGSGVALGLPAAYRRRGLLAHKANADTLPKISGAAAVLAGSCSAATLGQIAAFKGPHLHLDTDAICRGEAVGEAALAWARTLGNGPILLGQRQAGSGEGGSRNTASRNRARRSRRPWRRWPRAWAAGVGRLVVAGGETSGAVVGALDVTALRIGPEIDPGVPWTASVGAKPLLLALKSGNFGAPDFFTKAFQRL